MRQASGVAQHGANGSRILRRRIRRLFAAALLVPVTLLAATEPRQPTLRNARQIRSLSPAQAAQGYRVHLDRAQVLFVEASSGTVFLRDRADGLAAELRAPSAPGLHPGDLVTVDGVTGPGDSVPVILNPVMRVLGRAPLPDARDTSFDRLLSGAYQLRWVAVAGIVQAATVDAGDAKALSPRFLHLKLFSGEDALDVVASISRTVQLPTLVDAKVRIRAVVRNEWNERKLLVGAQLLMPDLTCLAILEPPPAADPFALPLVPIADMTTTGLREPNHRVHVRGIVTSTWGDRDFSLMDSGRATFVNAVDPIRVSVGDIADVAGFPTQGDYSEYLDGAQLRLAGSAPVPPALRLTAPQAFTGNHDVELVELEGELRARARGDDGVVTLDLSEDGISFHGVLPARSGQDALRTLAPGSRLRVRGVLVVHADRDHRPEKFDVLLRSPTDVAVLGAPSFWNFGRVAIAAVLLLTIALGVVVWNAVLRRRVRAQTRRIRAQLEEARSLREQAEAAHQQKSQALANLMLAQKDLLTAQAKLRYQASHDGLTGLWNRRALLEFLRRELERVRRHGSSVGILLLDLDHFKSVNDTRGHLAGDAVLREIGLRISGAIRPYDVAGRYGGEEFLIVLPECGREETERTAERIRLVISETPFSVARPSLSLTASLGAAVAVDSAQDATVLLHRADQALYEAKSAGRNCTRLFGAAVALQAG